MAKNYNNLSEEELKEKILMIADYIIENKCSTRKAANYATQKGFKISNVSVHRMIHVKLPEIDLVRYKKVLQIIKNNTPSSIEEAEVKSRIYSAAALALKDFTIPEIADILDSTKDIIYDDLTTRLEKLSPKLYSDVRLKLVEHRLENLHQYNENIPTEILEQEVTKMFGGGVIPTNEDSLKR